MKYTIDYFIKKFSAIPKSEWHIGELHNDYGDKHCALGFCERGGEVDEFFELKKHFAVRFLCIASINDGNSKLFQQKTPKGRVLAALKHIQKIAQYEAMLNVPL